MIPLLVIIGSLTLVIATPIILLRRRWLNEEAHRARLWRLEQERQSFENAQWAHTFSREALARPSAWSRRKEEEDSLLPSFILSRSSGLHRAQEAPSEPVFEAGGGQFGGGGGGLG